MLNKLKFIIQMSSGFFICTLNMVSNILVLKMKIGTVI